MIKGTLFFFLFFFSGVMIPVQNVLPVSNCTFVPAEPPGDPLFLKVNPQNGPFPISTKVIWVLGINSFYNTRLAEPERKESENGGHLKGDQFASGIEHHPKTLP